MIITGQRLCGNVIQKMILNTSTFKALNKDQTLKSKALLQCLLRASKHIFLMKIYKINCINLILLLLVLLLAVSMYC